MESDKKVIIETALQKLRWSTKNWGTEEEFAPGLVLQMREDSESPSYLVLTLTVTRAAERHWVGTIKKPSNRKTHIRTLKQEFVETKGRGKWFRDNTWRLSKAGIDHFSAGLITVWDGMNL